MHNYSAKDVLIGGFDLSLLKVGQSDTQLINAKIVRARDNIIARKKQAGTHNSYCYASDQEIYSTPGLMTEQDILSMIFDNDFLVMVSGIVYSHRASRYISHYIINIQIGTLLAANNQLSAKLMSWKDTSFRIKEYCIQNSIISNEELIKYMRTCGVAALPETSQYLLLELASPADAEMFIKSENDKVRLAAFKKTGPLDHLDEMIKDSSCVVRKYAVKIMAPNDKRLASFISDRSRYVFAQAMQKISIELVPMMLGSSHLKSKRIKDILAQRLESGQG